jgi:SAM-dependent methyltransferase
LVDHNVDPRVAAYDYIVDKYGGEARENNFHKNRNYRYYLRLAEAHMREMGRSQPYTILDIGSHCGFFLRFATENGWKAYGIEPAAPMVRFAREMNRVQHIEEGFFDTNSYSGQRFDLVTMFDVLEHIADPVGLLQPVRERLADGGLVLCKVPHVGFYLSWRATVDRLGKLGVLPPFPTFLSEPPEDARSSQLPGFFDLFEHVVHYDDNAVEAVFRRAGFQNWTLLPAPPTNPRGHHLNLPRTLVYRFSKVIHSLVKKNSPLTHGLLILAW